MTIFQMFQFIFR